MPFADVCVGLGDLVSIGDQKNALFRAFLQALMDHGGSIRHLDALLADAAGKRALLNDLAKKLIGPIWKLVETPVDLGVVDFNSPYQEFYNRYPRVPIAPGAREGQNSAWVGDGGPKGRPCKYQLFHFGKPVSFRRIRSTLLPEFAEFRELIAYVDRLKPEEWTGFSIVAPGSRFHVGQKVFMTFPTATVAEKEHCAQIAWHGVHDGDEDKPEYDTKNFFLVRVYDD